MFLLTKTIILESPGISASEFLHKSRLKFHSLLTSVVKMKFTLTHVIVLALLTRCKLGITSPVAVTSEVLADKVFVPLQYVGPITPGGEDVALNGTAQEIHAQIHQLNPSFRPEDFKGLETRNLQTGISRRNKLTPWCDPPGLGRASGEAQGSNIAYLEDLPGRCSLQAGPRVCTRLACTEGGGVFFCNDEKVAIDPSCAYLATYTVDIMNACCKLRPPWLLDCYGAGQVFDTDGYNVIVTAQNC